MKSGRVIGAGVLLLLLGAIAPAYAQEQDKEKQQQQDKNKQQQPPKQQPKQQSQPQPKQQPQQQPKQQPQQQPKQKPQQQQQHTQPQQQPPKQQPQQQPKQQQQTKQQQQPVNRTSQRPQQSSGGAYHGGVQPTAPTHGGVHPSGVPQHQGQVRSGFLQSRATSWDSQHRTWQQRGGYNGYRIPDDRFKLYFGADHFFRISSFPMLYVGGYPRFQYDGYWVTFLDPWPESWSPTWFETDDTYIDYTEDGYYIYDRNYPGIGIAVTISL